MINIAERFSHDSRSIFSLASRTPSASTLSLGLNTKLS